MLQKSISTELFEYAYLHCLLSTPPLSHCVLEILFGFHHKHQIFI